MKKCNACNAEFEGNFCPMCGKKWEPAIPTCPQCGSKVKEGANFCAECGFALKKATPAPNNNTQTATPPASQGLEFELNEDGNYSVVGFGTCKDTHLVIPKTYNGKLVTEFFPIDPEEGESTVDFNLAQRIESIHFHDRIFIGTDGYFSDYNPDYDRECCVLGNFKNLKKVTIDDNNPYYRMQDNAIIDKSDNSLIFSLGNKIPNGIKEIWPHAFCFSNIESITIPESVTVLPEVFYSCPNLKEVTILCPSVYSALFINCDQIERITLGPRVTYIEVVDSEDGAGCFCRELKNLTQISVDRNNPRYYSYQNCLIDCQSKTLIAGCKTSVLPTDGSIKSIGDGAFHGIGIKEITIPRSIYSIGTSAFAHSNRFMEIKYLGTKYEWIKMVGDPNDEEIPIIWGIGYGYGGRRKKDLPDTRSGWVPPISKCSVFCSDGCVKYAYRTQEVSKNNTITSYYGEYYGEYYE